MAMALVIGPERIWGQVMAKEYRFTVTYSVRDGWQADFENVADSNVFDLKAREYVEPSSLDRAANDLLGDTLDGVLTHAKEPSERDFFTFAQA